MGNTFTSSGASGPASGSIIDEDTTRLFLGSQNLSIESQQSNAATDGADYSDVIQRAILTAEASVFGSLLQLRCKAGTFFKYPFTVGGVALKSSGSVIALPILQAVAHGRAALELNRARMIMGVTDDNAGIAGILKRLAEAADGELRKIIRWAEGYTDGQFVDLDLTAGAVVGQISISVIAPSFAGATVGPSGLPVYPVIEGMIWLWGSRWGYPLGRLPGC